MRGKLTGNQKKALPSLLNMDYLRSEIAREIGIPARWFSRAYIPNGCPTHTYNKQTYINGREFARWYVSKYTRIAMEQDEAWCITCGMPRLITDPKTFEKTHGLFIKGTCGVCGRIIGRMNWS